jgi:simple sugar transport system permease protein
VNFDYIISFIFAAVLAGTPLLYGTLGEILTEKSGNLNLGVEGLMYMGAAMGLIAGYYTNSAILAIVGAFLTGVVGSFIFSFITVTLKANQNVTGLTLTIFGVAFGNFVGDAFQKANGGTAFVSKSVMSAFANINIPVLSSIPYVGRLLFQYNIFVYLAIFLSIILAIYMKKTRAGLNLRAVGEDPATADAAGISVNKYRYLATCVGGGICGIGGVYVVMATCGGTWVYNCVNGLGWISVALVIFAAWSPRRAIIGSLVFGALSVVRLYLSINIPIAIYAMLPFAVTILVLIVSSVRQNKEMQQPAGCGLNYFREER